MLSDGANDPNARRGRRAPRVLGARGRHRDRRRRDLVRPVDHEPGDAPVSLGLPALEPGLAPQEHHDQRW